MATAATAGPPATTGPLKYNTDLKAEVTVKVGPAPHVKVHSVEWQKIMDGLPVEINPSTGSGFKARAHVTLCMRLGWTNPTSCMRLE